MNSLEPRKATNGRLAFSLSFLSWGEGNGAALLSELNRPGTTSMALPTEKDLRFAGLNGLLLPTFFFFSPNT